MNLSNSQGLTDNLADVLTYIRSKGGRVWAENGQLRYKAPKGAFAREEIERLRVLLKSATREATQLRLDSGPLLDRIPLTFSQQTHWHQYRLRERHAIRQIASATRLRGRLEVSALQRSIEEIVNRHDALRTRIVILDRTPTQEVAKSGRCELEIEDLTGLCESVRETEVKRFIEEHILEPIYVATGPLWGVRLLRLRKDEYVLIVAMEHIISDMFSLDILLRDVFTAYMQELTNRPFSLPPICVQFPDYAMWQRNSHASWLDKHGRYWSKRLAGCQRVRFPEERIEPTEKRLGWGIVPVTIEQDWKAQLHEWCRLRQTTLVMSVFTAYVALVLLWCGVSEAVIQYMTDGRVSPKIENTIGFFASPLLLRIELLADDTIVDLMSRIRAEYCDAAQHADSFYLEAQVPRPEFTRNTVFNWVPKGSTMGSSALLGSDYGITCSSISFEHPMLKSLERDTEPFVMIHDSDDEIIGGVYFPMERFSFETMKRFGRNFLLVTNTLLRNPEQRVKDISLV